MANIESYLQKYRESRAIVIGIDKYNHASPLLHACNDASAVAKTLVDLFAFPKENVELLVNDKATKAEILQAFLRLADGSVTEADDRILVFFAGHGHTVTGRRGETGFLVPVDGRPDDLSTLIRWDELTRNADLIPAKHILFLMDACYGGLALSRNTIPPGSMRFLKDMLQRYSRQVLTAGKADEVVSDGGGTRAGHSIFTSHLLDGMDGAAASGPILTGHALMAYVYDKVGGDPLSQQTPHFGFLDGDGDFIFDVTALIKLDETETSDPKSNVDIFIKSPSISVPEVAATETVADILKRLIADPTQKIKLNDFINEVLRKTSESLSQEQFAINAPVTNEGFSARIQKYEEAIADLTVVVILLARWADPDQLNFLEKIYSRISEIEYPQAGPVVWIRLFWYPLLFLMYAGGISALSAHRSTALRVSIFSPIYSERRILDQTNPPAILAVVSYMTEIVEQFKRLPGYERAYVPRSEHIYKRLQPLLEDQLFLGRSYDQLFDDFEIILALSYADLRDKDPTTHVWGPPGRFAWKHTSGRGPSPYERFVSSAKNRGGNWDLLDEGFFSGSDKRFSDIADAYRNLLSKINWW
ncbi:MAG: caspase family protein [Xanthobacteraceae bacterium]|nr:caspase family protein [Xanthobacteraceae bacterium]